MMDLGMLGPELRAIAERVVEARPWCAALLCIEEAQGQRLLVLRSPTDEKARNVVLWDDDGDLGLGFGEWHTHGNIAGWTRDAGDEVSSLTAIVLAIVDGELVGTVEVAHEGSVGLLDLAVPDALAEELTSRFSSGQITILTWSGRGDRELSLDDIS